jgi:hypothetical protein
MQFSNNHVKKYLLFEEYQQRRLGFRIEADSKNNLMSFIFSKVKRSDPKKEFSILITFSKENRNYQCKLFFLNISV